MPHSTPAVRLIEVDTHVLPTRTRFPFRYGIAAMTSAPHLVLRACFEIDGERSIGIASEGLPPKWFTKTPDTTFEQDLPDLLMVIRHAIDGAIAVAEAPTFFDWWQQVYTAQSAWSEQENVPPLLAHLGTSLIERAGIDALCRGIGKSFRDAVADNDLGLRLDAIHPGLDSSFSPPASKSSLVFARHTIGLADPLGDADILPEDLADDGLPQSLDACIDAYGLRYFKIKICGKLDTDLPRLIAIAKRLESKAPGYRYTLDGNEQYRSMAEFRAHWEAFHSEPELSTFLSTEHLLFVEQPVHRDQALNDSIAGEIAAWPDAPPLIIDESDAHLDSASRALELGYSGTSHKNCKGVIKGIANCALLARRRAEHPELPTILSGEDLANIGPVALQQDLSVMHLLGIEHVERNGHHYFRGLSAYPPSVQAAALERHGDLYHRHELGFAAVNVREGSIDIGSVINAPFGTAFRIDEVADDWQWIPHHQLSVDELVIEN